MPKRRGLRPLPAFRLLVLVLSILSLPLVLAGCAPARHSEPGDHAAFESVLRESWRIAPASATPNGGAEVATQGFDDGDWTPTSVPSTVVAALYRAGEIPDPYYARNLEALDAGRFDEPWWYRTVFSIDDSLPDTASLVFEGINYAADVWLNGHKVAAREELEGSFRIWELDVTGRLSAGANALAVLVHPPKPGDPSLGFVDWNPTSPDRNMGLWREVRLRRTGSTSLADVFMRTEVDLDTLDKAWLTLEVTVRNHSDDPVSATVAGTVTGGVEFEHEVELDANEHRRLTLTANTIPAFEIASPRLWWPNLMGEPELYDLGLELRTGNEIADRKAVTFGIREVSDYLTEEGYRGYAVNGKKVLIRGGGWVDDMLLADTDRKIEDQIRYAKHMNLNTLRLEGFWGSSQRLYELADRYGLLVIVGWSCQWEWEEYLGAPVDEFGGIDTPEEMSLVSRSLADQVRWLRNHPSVLVWALASDMLPRPELERRYYAELAEVDPTRPTLASCARGVSEVSGPSGVKMLGPYDWVAPSYWYLDSERGGAYGFNSETGPGPQPPPADSIRRMLPEENWWPIDDMWHYHCGRHNFNTLDRYREALDRRYGPTKGLDEFARVAQVANYEGMRAMFEAFSIRRPETTGLIQWMLNSAWPEMYWQLYDHYLVPNGAFYGARDASRPTNIAYDYADRGIVVVNDTGRELAGATVRLRVLDLDSKTLFEDEISLDVAAESLERVATLPPIATSGGAYFLDARLETAADTEDSAATGSTELARSLYWLSTSEDVHDWDASEWFVTPMADYADLTGLARMPEVALDVEHRFDGTSEGYDVAVTLSNPSERLAFFVELKIMGAESGRRAAPVLWSDNYVTLLPGETLRVKGSIPSHALGDEEPVLSYRGINVPGPA